MRILKDDIGRLAAKLHCHFLHMPRRLGIDRRPCRIRTGKGNFCYFRMIDQRTSRLGSETSDNIDHAGREHLFGNLHKFQRRGRRVLGRLDNRGVASRQ